jgi:dihydroorotate dehydrogenase (fumarate)
VKAVKSVVKIPVAAKLTPFFSNMAHMAKRFDEAGVDGLVLFNRFYQPDIDLDALEIQPSVLLSTSQDLRLPLTWIGILFGRIKASLAGSSGVHSPEDVVKLLLVGADVTMVCSTLLRNGVNHLGDLEAGLRQWVEKHEYNSVTQMRGGLSQIRCPDAGAFERAQYVNAVKGIQNVVLTGREAWRVLSGQ